MHSSRKRTDRSTPHGGRGLCLWGFCPEGGPLSMGVKGEGGSVQDGGLC